MKKLIQKLMNMLSRANKENILLRQQVADMRQKNNRLEETIDEWRIAFDEHEAFWSEKFYDQKYYNSQLRLMAENTIRILAQSKEEDAWLEAMTKKYNATPYSDDVADLLYWENDQEQFADELQQQYDDDYLVWVETELFYPD